MLVTLTYLLSNVSLEYRDHTCFFHALTFAGSRGCCLNSRPIGRVIKHLPRDPTSVNAMKKTCVIVILAYLTLFYQIRTENAAKTLNCPFFYT